MVFLKDVEASGAEAATVNAGLIVAMLAIYAGIYFSASKIFPFCVTGNRVSRTSVKSARLSAGFISGVGMLASSVFVGSVSELTSSAVAVLGAFFICVGLLVHERHAIRGLRTLRIKQKTLPAPYTFMQIDEIREARSCWWLGRLFKWVASWRTSSST
ncbi:hypothetical protein K0038_05032 [Pseudomonas syringae]|nr:hypothetical protein [Pseudomonas syringae]